MTLTTERPNTINHYTKSGGRHSSPPNLLYSRHLTQSRWTTISEIWKTYAKNYEVSNFGRVRRKTPDHGATVGRELIGCISNRGYRSYGINGKTTNAHRMVAHCFLGPRPNLKHQVNHIDGNKLNNHISNLEYVTNQENAIHASMLGLLPKGEQKPFSKLQTHQIKQIRTSYSNGGITQRELGIQYGICQQTVNRIIHRKTWRHVQ